MTTMTEHLNVFSKAIDLRVKRHQVLASNIANADTPHYKARDFDFQSAMTRAMGAGASGGGLEMARTDRQHLDGNGGMGSNPLLYRTSTQSAVDGNTVDMDVERGQITENAMQYEVLTKLIADKFQGIRAAMATGQ